MLNLRETHTNGATTTMPEWLIVYSTNDLADAHIQAGRLEVEAIPVMVHGQPGASALGITIGTLGEIHVLVRPQDYDTALEILEAEDHPELPDTSNAVIYRGTSEQDHHDPQ